MTNKGKKANKMKFMQVLKDDALLGQIKIESENKEVEQLFQVIPRRLWEALSEAACGKGVALDEEVSLRLIATVIDHKTFGFNPEIDALLKSSVSHTQDDLEKEQQRLGWGYIFEREKLKLLLEFKSKLPKDHKENFIYLDEHEESKVLKRELGQRG